MFSTGIAINQLIGGEKINSSLTLVNIVSSLTDNYTINGDLNLTGGTLSLNGNTINVTGNFVLSGGTVDLAQGEIDINGNLTQTGGTLNVDGGYLGVSCNYTLQNDSLLIITNTDDYVFVNGNFTTNTSNNESGSLSDGVLEVAGDFSQGDSAYSFAASGDFDVILSGSTLQNIYFVNLNKSQFNNLDRMGTRSIQRNYIGSDDINGLFRFCKGFKDFVLGVLSSIYNNGIEDINILLTVLNSLFGREYAGETYRLIEGFKQGIIESIKSRVTNVVAYDVGKIITDIDFVFVSVKAVAESFGVISIGASTVAESGIFTVFSGGILSPLCIITATAGIVTVALGAAVVVAGAEAALNSGVNVAADTADLMKNISNNGGGAGGEADAIELTVSEFSAPSTGKVIKAYVEEDVAVPIDKIDIYMHGGVKDVKAELNQLQQLKQITN